MGLGILLIFVSIVALSSGTVIEVQETTDIYTIRATYNNNFETRGKISHSEPYRLLDDATKASGVILSLALPQSVLQGPSNFLQLGLNNGANIAFLYQENNAQNLSNYYVAEADPQLYKLITKYIPVDVWAYTAVGNPYKYAQHLVNEVGVNNLDGIFEEIFNGDEVDMSQPLHSNLYFGMFKSLHAPVVVRHLYMQAGPVRQAIAKAYKNGLYVNTYLITLNAQHAWVVSASSASGITNCGRFVRSTMFTDLGLNCVTLD